MEGKKLIGKALELARWIRSALENIPGLKILDEEVVGKPGSYSLDPTKTTVIFYLKQTRFPYNS